MNKWLKWLMSLPLIALILFNLWAYGNVMTLRVLAPDNTAFMRQRMAQLAQTRPDVHLQYRWVDYAQISPNLKKAIIASEDATFAVHEGFDWQGMKQAIKRNWQQGEVKAGGSTISQQLAKNLFLTEKRSYLRKAEEAVITAMLEATMDKERIYAIYLNIIEWDYGVYGAEAASQHFYGKSASQLSKTQAAQLAARVSAPLRYADNPKDPRLSRKTQIILKRMGSAELPE